MQLDLVVFNIFFSFSSLISQMLSRLSKTLHATANSCIDADISSLDDAFSSAMLLTSSILVLTSEKNFPKYHKTISHRRTLSLFYRSQSVIPDLTAHERYLNNSQIEIVLLPKRRKMFSEELFHFLDLKRLAQEHSICNVKNSIKIMIHFKITT